MVVALIIQTQAPLNHLVVMALSVVAVDAEVVVLQEKKSQSSAADRARTTRAESRVVPREQHQGPVQAHAGCLWVQPHRAQAG